MSPSGCIYKPGIDGIGTLPRLLFCLSPAPYLHRWHRVLSTNSYLFKQSIEATSNPLLSLLMTVTVASTRVTATVYRITFLLSLVLQHGTRALGSPLFTSFGPGIATATNKGHKNEGSDPSSAEFWYHMFISMLLVLAGGVCAGYDKFSRSPMIYEAYHYEPLG
jgi:hypothetical protein